MLHSQIATYWYKLFDQLLDSENDAGSWWSAGWQALSEWMCAVEWRQWLTMATGCFSGRKFVHFVDFVCFE
jgi:hypothetical protein